MSIQNFNQIFPETCLDGIDLIDRLIQFDPHDRLGAAATLEHPFLLNCPGRNRATEYTYRGSDLLQSIAQLKRESGQNLMSNIMRELDIYNRKYWELESGAVGLEICPPMDNAMDVYA